MLRMHSTCAPLILRVGEESFVITSPTVSTPASCDVSMSLNNGYVLDFVVTFAQCAYTVQGAPQSLDLDYRDGGVGD